MEKRSLQKIKYELIPCNKDNCHEDGESDWCDFYRALPESYWGFPLHDFDGTGKCTVKKIVRRKGASYWKSIDILPSAFDKSSIGKE